MPVIVWSINKKRRSTFHDTLTDTKEKYSVLTLFDYKLAAQLSLGLASSTEFLRRPTPSGLSLIELHCDGLVLTVVWSLLSESNIVSLAPASYLDVSNCNNKNENC